MEMEEKKTVPGIIEEVVGRICDEFCRWPDEYIEEEDLYRAHCNDCPLNLLTQ